MKGRGMEEDKEMCCVCARNGKTSKLKTYQINFEEAIRFCEDDECTYPAGMDNTSWVLNRKFSELQVSKPSAMKKKTSQQSGYVSGKFTKYKSGMQQNKSKSPVCRNPARLTSGPCLNQQPLKNGQSSYVQVPITRSLETIKTLSAPANNSGTQIQPSIQLFTEKGTQNKETVAPRKENKFESYAQSSDVARQLVVDKGGKCSPNTVDELRAFYPQWQNKDALCWMDVILCLLVHCKQVKKLNSGDRDSDSSIVCTLLKAYDQALSLLNKKSIFNAMSSPYDVDLTIMKSDNTMVEPKINSASSVWFDEKVGTGCNDEDKSRVCLKSVGMSLQEDEVKTGAGLKLLKSDLVPLMSSHGDLKYSTAFDLLTEIREKIWHLLHPRLQCKKGKNDSPVFAIPLLTKNSKDLEQLLAIKYNFHFNCTQCGFQDILPYEKVLPTFPNTTPNFSMKEPKFVRPCFKCSAVGQCMTMRFERLPPVVMLHFQEGLQSNSFSSYDFWHQDQLYQVTGVIQYRNDPDHFIAWIRKPKEELWMECNDLKSPLCQFDQQSPNFPASQVHIMMWEAVNIENGCKVSVQNDSRPVCTEEDLQNGHATVSMGSSGHVTVSMGNGFHVNRSLENGGHVNRSMGNNGHVKGSMRNSQMNLRNLGTFVTNKGDSMHLVTENGNAVSTSTPSHSLSLPTTLSLTPMGAPSTGSQNMNERSQFTNKRPAADVEKVTKAQLDKMLSSPNTQKLNEIRRLQLGNSNKSQPPVDRNFLVHTQRTDHIKLESTRSTRPDKILEKTKNNVSLLRNMRNPRTPQIDNKALSQEQLRRPEYLRSQGSLSILSRILSNSKNKTPVSPVVRGKVFEGYKSRMSDVTSFTSKNRTRSTCSEVDTESLASRPNSPALSCHSDSIIIQKRKAELVSESVTLPVLKRRRSQDTNLGPNTVHLRIHNKSLSLDSATMPTNEQMICPRTVNSGVNDKSSVTTTIDGQCSNDELFVSASRTDGTFQESDILQNLYSALNIAMPAPVDNSNKAPASPVKGSEASQMDVENIPDISGLDKFINSDCDSNMDDNFDDFLSQL